MLHPTTAWINLRKLMRCSPRNLTVVVKENGARACRSLVERKYILHLASLDAPAFEDDLSDHFEVAPLRLRLIQQRPLPRRQKRTNEQLVGSAAHDSTYQRSNDWDPPVALRRRQRRRTPAHQKAKEPRAKVARRVERPSLQVTHRCSDQRNQKSDHHCATVRSRGHLVVLLRNSEDPEN